MDLYFDSSSLVKYFQREEGSEQVNSLIESDENSVYVSELSKVEIMSAIYRKYRNNKINRNGLLDIIKDIEKLIDNFHIEPLNSTIVDEAQEVLENIGVDICLRSLDALHLATYNLISASDEWKFVSNDSTQIQAAESLGYITLIPG